MASAPTASHRTALQRTGRADIQGLRALAVLLVVLYHAGLPGLKGGYIGVDVFFVISGYLITGLLAREIERKGRVDYLGFLSRRARRLLPASIVLIAAVCAAAHWVYPAAERTETLSAALASTLYVANFWFALDAIDYLGGAGSGNPLLHMWSLGVEEQFYLVWPLLLAGAVALRWGTARQRLLAATAVVALISLAACLLVTWKAQPWAFFASPTRAWEFALGACVVLTEDRWARTAPGVRRTLGAAGVAAVLLGALLLDDQVLFPGAWALLPALGTALILAALTAQDQGLLQRCLSTPAMVRIGDVSYSWYLWHWPLIVMGGALTPDPSATWVAVLVVLSYGLAELSYRFVEQPFRHGRIAQISPRWVVGTAALVTGTTATALSLGRAQLEQAATSPAQQVFRQAMRDTPAVYRLGCHVPISATEPRRCEMGPKDAAFTVVLVGDSHAAHWFPALEAVAQREQWRLVSMTKSACPWVDTPTRAGQLRRRYSECEAWRTQALDEIERIAPRMVILANGQHRDYVDPTDWQAGARRSLQRVRGTGATAVVLRDTAWPGFDVPRCLARAEHRGAALADACRFSAQQGLRSMAAIAQAEQQAVAAVHGSAWVDLTPAVCPAEPCTVFEGGVVRFSDHSHLSARFALQLADPLARELRGLAPPAR